MVGQPLEKRKCREVSTRVSVDQSRRAREETKADNLIEVLGVDKLKHCEVAQIFFVETEVVRMTDPSACVGHAWLGLILRSWKRALWEILPFGQ